MHIYIYICMYAHILSTYLSTYSPTYIQTHLPLGPDQIENFPTAFLARIFGVQHEVNLLFPVVDHHRCARVAPLIYIYTNF